jgi:glycine betaine/proline transport system permease protein
MVVIASMIAAGFHLHIDMPSNDRKYMGLATVGVRGIELLAIVLDRITQAMGQTTRGGARWWHSGPAGCVARLLGAGHKPAHRGGTH